MARLVFGDPIPAGVYPWPEDAARADRDRIKELEADIFRWEMEQNRLEDEIAALGDRIDAAQAEIDRLGGVEV